MHLRAHVFPPIDSLVCDIYVMAPAGRHSSSSARVPSVACEFAGFGSRRRGQVMELSNYELVRYPSGQLVLMKGGTNAQGLPSSAPRDVVGVFSNEAEAQSALARLVGGPGPHAAPAPRGALRG